MNPSLRRQWRRTTNLALIVGMLGALAVLTGCASRRVTVARGVRIDLMAPATLGADVAVVQKVEATRNDRTYSFLSQVEITHDRLVVAGLTESGGRAFLLTDDGHDVAIEQHPLVQQQLPANYLLADLQLMYWPLDTLASALHGGRIVEHDGERTIYRGTVPVIHIIRDGSDPWSGVVTYTHLERGYRLVIRSQAQDAE